MRTMRLARAALAASVGLVLSAAALAQGMGQMPGGGRQHMMEGMPGQMGSGMGPGMGSGMGQGMGMQERHGGRMGPFMQGAPGMAGLFGLRVLPRLHLSVDDVQFYLTQRLERIGNDRLKLGEVKEKDANTITASVLTKDDSLVQALEVDRNTGLITYE